MLGAMPVDVPGLLHPHIARWFKKRFGAFTPAQEAAIPAVARGESILLTAPTGSGKTLAGFLAIINQLYREQEAGGDPPGICALYVSPLRALGYDIEKNLAAPLRELGLSERIRVGVRSGDSTAGDRAKQKRRPPHILITTPESLAIVLAQPSFAPALARVRYLILDEIHSLADNNRGSFLSLSVERLEALRPPGNPPLTRVGLSATVASLERMGHFLAGMGRPCLLAPTTHQREPLVEVYSPLRRNPYPPSGYVGSRAVAEVANLVRKKKSVMICTNTRGNAEAFGLRLKVAAPELAERIEVHHSSLDRSVRLDVEDRLKDGKLRAVVCTTSLEMGIDIGAVDLVIMISAPKSVARAVQRIGRSGHSVHKTSHGMFVASNIIDLVECAVTAQLVRDRKLDETFFYGTCLDVLAQHIVGMTLQGPIAADAAFALVKRAYPYRDLPRVDFNRILHYLQGGGRSLERQYTREFGKIYLDPADVIHVSPTLRPVDYLLNVGTITEGGAVSILMGRRRLGTVEEPFMKALNVGDIFVMGGRTVRLLEAGVHTARVEAASGATPTIPRWHAGKMPLSSGVADSVTALRTEADTRLRVAGETDGQVADWIVETWGVSLANAAAIVASFRAQMAVSCIPREGLFLIELFREDQRTCVFFHSLIGRKGNDALSRIVAWRWRQANGGNAQVTIDDYGFMLAVKKRDEVTLEDCRAMFDRAEAEGDLQAALLESPLVRWQFRNVAQTGLMVPRNSIRGERRARQLQWSSEILYTVLREHEPDHPLLGEAMQQATHTFLDAPRAYEFLERAGRLEWRMLEVRTVSPFGFGVYASGIKEIMTFESPDEAVERISHELYREVEEAAAAAAVARGDQK